MPVVGFPNPAIAGLDWSRGVLVRGPISGPELIQFVKKHIGPNVLQGCRSIRLNLYELSFREKDTADRFFALGETFDVDGKIVEQRRAGESVRVVYVHGLPFPFPDAVLRHYMSAYGEIRGIQRERWADLEEETGVRLVRLVVGRDPPNFLRMGDFLARLSYAGLKRVCRKCGKDGHLAESCDILRCFNCSGEGHVAAACTLPCHLCQNAGHSYLACSRKTFARVLAGASEVEQTGNDFPVTDASVEVPAAVTAGPAVIPDIAAASTAVTSETVVPKPAATATVSDISFDVQLEAALKSLPASQTSESDAEPIAPPVKKTCTKSQPRTVATPLSERSKFPEDPRAVFVQKDGKKFSVDLLDIFPGMEVLQLSFRRKKQPGLTVAGYWQASRHRLYLRSSEREKLEQFVEDHKV